MATLPGTVGKYRVLGNLGKGAMGDVYTGEDPYLGRRVAIKVLRGTEGDSAERFLHEARIIGGFSHPNIVTLLEFGFEADQPFLVMELVEGHSLDAWLREPRTLEEQLRVMAGLLAALDYAHARGVLHRDIKPSNVQVLPDGQCKLMDFGIAHAPTSKLTATGTVMGTPMYMAPETLETAAYSPLSDLYSAAVVFYEMLTGANPFAGASVGASLHKVLHVTPEPLRLRRPDIPQALADAIDACLDKRPEARVPGAAALLQVVAAAGREPTAGETHALPALRTQPRVQPAAPAPRRGQPPVAIGAAVVLALLLAGWWLASRPVAPSVVLPSTVAPAPVAAASMPPPVTSPPTTVPPPPAFARESTVPRPKPTPRPPPERVDTLPAPPITVPVQATPAPLSTLPASVPSAQPPVPPSTQPAPAPVLLPELTGINPRSARRGVTVKLELRGRRLSRELQVLVLHGRRPVAGVRVLEQRFVDAERITLTLLVDADAPLDTYAIALRDAQGNISNSLPFEVAL